MKPKNNNTLSDVSVETINLLLKIIRHTPDDRLVAVSKVLSRTALSRVVRTVLSDPDKMKAVHQLIIKDKKTLNN